MRGASARVLLIGICIMADAIFAQAQQVYSNPDYETGS
jgi:hypothetical protein